MCYHAGTMYSALMKLVHKYQRLVRFLFTGGVAALVFFATYFLCTQVLGAWYMLASTTAFLVTGVVNFLMQKRFVFNDREKRGTSRKFALFISSSVVYYALNIAAMYTLVEIVTLHDFLAQVIVIGVLAIVNYAVYRFIIFRPDSTNAGM